MTSQVIVAIVGLSVATLSFLLGAYRSRNMSEGGTIAVTATLQRDIGDIRVIVERNGNRITALEQAARADEAHENALHEAQRGLTRLEALLGALGERLEDRYDATRALYGRLDDLAQRVAEIKTLCTERNKTHAGGCAV